MVVLERGKMFFPLLLVPNPTKNLTDWHKLYQILSPNIAIDIKTPTELIVFERHNGVDYRSPVGMVCCSTVSRALFVYVVRVYYLAVIVMS